MQEKHGSSPFGEAKGRTWAQKAGLSYQRKVVAEITNQIPDARAGVWFEFMDSKGFGLAQPDLVIPFEGAIYVAEIKLTFVPAAMTQLSALYIPLLQALHKEPVLGLVVCKSLRKGTPRERIADTLSGALDLAWDGIPILHWLGKVALQ